MSQRLGRAYSKGILNHMEATLETRERTIVKGLIWIFMGLVVMSLVGLLFTGSMAVGGTMALVNSLIGFVNYVLYERFWAKVNWGRQPDVSPSGGRRAA